MKTGRKLFAGALLVLYIVLAAGCNSAKTNVALPEVRNNGTAIQWKYSDETDWRDLVALSELRGTAGANGKDGADGINGKNGTDGKDGADGINGKDGIDGKNGINGTDGKDGINGKDGADGIDGKDGADGANAKNIEVQRAETHIQWRYEGEDWQNLVAIADITGPTGQKGSDGANGKTPEFRVNENTLQWRYVGDGIWLNLYDLTALKGADGQNGKDGINGQDGKDGAGGKDGNTPFIGENGNWWIGEIDTGVKAAGIDGTDGEKGDQGEKGDKREKGDKGDMGDAGQNGGSSGYFHAKASVGTALLQNHSARIEFTEKINRGGLISASPNEITLKKGHTYNIIISGSLGVSSNASGNTGYYCIQMTDSSEDADFCRNITRIKRDGTKLPYSNDYHSFNFNRMYDASARDITLKFIFEQSEYNTLLVEFIGTITITALD